MSANLTLLLVMGVLFACGIYLLLERSLTRVLLGLMLLTNATNLLLLATGGYAGLAPLFGKDIPPQAYADPLPQALILTSIVISFAVTSFLLALIYRSWQLGRADDVQDDIEDRRVAKQGSFDTEEDSYAAPDTTEFSPDENDAPPHRAGRSAAGDGSAGKVSAGKGYVSKGAASKGSAGKGKGGRR